MRKIAGLVLFALMVGASTTGGSLAKQAFEGQTRYSVLARRGVSSSEARSTLRSLGARVVTSNPAIGLSTVAAGPGFIAGAMSTGVFSGVVRDRVIGLAPEEWQKPSFAPHPSTSVSRPRLTRSARGSKGDPYFRYQWWLRQIDAGPSTSYPIDKGDERVRVGVIDTGIQANHPDVGSNFSARLSRNFTRDIPSVDGRCRKEPDHSCNDPVTVDESGHGTWAAAAIAGTKNGIGISGVAPGVTIANLRAGQDSGYFFVQPVVDALTYAGDHGFDVASMGFNVDPWVFNCEDNPRDSPEAQQEQRTILDAVGRAVLYAEERDVTIVASIGDQWTDLGNPTVDKRSPDFPPGKAYERDIDNSCETTPAEAVRVVAVAGTGPSGRKAWLSNYGLEDFGVEPTDLAAPSGDGFDDDRRDPTNMVLSAWSRSGLRALGLITKRGRPKSDSVIRRCGKEARPKCAYWFFTEGTSMSAALAGGVAALIVSKFGDNDDGSGRHMEPEDVWPILFETAHQHPCPEGGVQRYPEIGDRYEDEGYSTDDFTATCEESGDRNGFFGYGIVNALDALRYED